jgi:hypothetical protein
VRIDEFRRAVRQEFGKRLEHATPANVREFLDKMGEREFESRGSRRRIEICEEQTTYESILKDFYARVLEMPPEEGMMLLWTMSFEMSFAMLEHDLSERFDHLFGEVAD